MEQVRVEAAGRRDDTADELRAPVGAFGPADPGETERDALTEVEPSGPPPDTRPGRRC
ncbi:MULTISPECIES: hypothetical protein [unclassified Streptomyces]|uniref:hypothetical protein n=1 Tax=unclassified Streptomyces TaxID=2593676 RepID=UPI003702ED5B